MTRKKTKLILFSLLLFGVEALHAQQSTVASGGTATGTGGSATYSVGQVAAERIGNTSTGTVGEGVQQPYEYMIGIDEINGITVTMMVYPNPSSSVINLKIDSDKLTDVSYLLYDVQEKLLITNAITKELTTISLDNYGAGNYTLTILNKKEKVKSFQLTKTN